MIRFLSTLRLSPDGGETSGDPEPVPAPTTPTHSAPPPPAATTVIAGGKTEASVADEMDAKKLQQRIAQLEDERRQFIEAQERALAPKTSPAVAQKKSWLDGGSFFD